MTQPIFKRKIYSRIEEWKAKSNGKTALLIEGARRVGKSTIAEEFARNNYQSYLLIDFTKVRKDVIDLFDDLSDLHYFFLTLQSLTGTKLTPGKSCIIFDEVQFCPKARQAIKHLVSDGRFHYIETGSLISIKKNICNILIPSEERRIEMHPLDFEEFLWAIGKEPTFDLIRYSYEHQKSLGDAVNRDMMRLFRLYMLVGGMPQAIDEYLNGSGFENARLSRMEEIFADINESRTVNFAYHANDPNVGFALHAGYDAFKMYLADTGLFITLAFMDRDFTENLIYEKLLTDKHPADMGYIYENMVAQMLRSNGHSLYYHTFKERSSDSNEPRAYEIDFLISRHGKICPIEVKSSGYKSHKSLDEFQRKYPSRIQQRYLIYTKDLRKEHDIIYLPIYMTELL